MVWQEFHHPDISWPVVRRKAGIELLELLELSALFLTKGGWGLINRHCYPSDAAYRTATSRLRTQGLLVKKQSAAKTPKLILTDAGKKRIPAYFSPEQYWNRTWNKIWYMLIYDIPETDRKYRDVLRQFLRRKRMGCLQKSVWITPEDIRPDFDDLSKAANIDAFAYLIEGRTVLGTPSWRIVEDAWDFGRIGQIQGHYCSVMEQNIKLLKEGRTPPEDIASLLRTAVDGYHAAMHGDPLLPTPLLPESYRGKEAYALHCAMLHEVDRQTACYNQVHDRRNNCNTPRGWSNRFPATPPILPEPYGGKGAHTLFCALLHEVDRQTACYNQVHDRRNNCNTRKGWPNRFPATPILPEPYGGKGAHTLFFALLHEVDRQTACYNQVHDRRNNCNTRKGWPNRFPATPILPEPYGGKEAYALFCALLHEVGRQTACYNQAHDRRNNCNTRKGWSNRFPATPILPEPYGGKGAHTHFFALLHEVDRQTACHNQAHDRRNNCNTPRGWSNRFPATLIPCLSG